MARKHTRNGPGTQDSIRKSFEACAAHIINNPKEYLLIVILPTSHINKMGKIMYSHDKLKSPAQGDTPNSGRQDALPKFG